mmetsp:Transcript_117050/g.377728  ORF Transcript_117050/g.377728 Transcript_117050/m.377728 type:complete len:256 (-) Transcript_117050:53-820(-)
MEPLPAPIRLSATRWVIPEFGKMRIQILPFLSITLTMVRRTVSITLLEIHASSKTCSPYLPKWGLLHLVAYPRNFHLVEWWKGLTGGLWGFFHLMIFGMSKFMETLLSASSGAGPVLGGRVAPAKASCAGMGVVPRPCVNAFRPSLLALPADGLLSATNAAKAVRAAATARPRPRPRTVAAYCEARCPASQAAAALAPRGHAPTDAGAGGDTTKAGPHFARPVAASARAAAAARRRRWRPTGCAVSGMLCRKRRG